MRDLFYEIKRVLPEGGEWCDLDKANTLAALVVALRPKIVVEIGVFMGGSLIPILLAMKHASYGGRAIGIDPWAADASVVGQAGANAEWWATVDHERAMRVFLERLERHKLSGICDVWRQKSDDATPPIEIDLLHVDGNHADAAVRDVERFAPCVPIGGILVMDDLGWEGGAVGRAHALACAMGFADLYPLGTGCVMQRRHGALLPVG